MLADLYCTGHTSRTVCKAIRKVIFDEQWWATMHYLAMQVASQRASGSQTGILTPPPLPLPWGNLAMSRDIYGCHTWGDGGCGRVLLTSPKRPTVLRLNIFSLDLSWDSVPLHQNSCSYTASDLTNCCLKNKNAFQHSIVRCPFIAIKYLVTIQKTSICFPERTPLTILK